MQPDRASTPCIAFEAELDTELLAQEAGAGVLGFVEGVRAESSHSSAAQHGTDSVRGVATGLVALQSVQPHVQAAGDVLRGST